MNKLCERIFLSFLAGINKSMLDLKFYVYKISNCYCKETKKQVCRTGNKQSRNGPQNQSFELQWTAQQVIELRWTIIIMKKKCELRKNIKIV